MIRPTASLLLAFGLSHGALPVAAQADAPQVLTDTVPIQALTARIMDGVGAPELLLAPGASPHDFALRPSDARRLAEADVIVWTGPALNLWLPEALATLAPDAATLALLESQGWDPLALRDDPRFDAGHEGHDHGADGHDDHGDHDDHSDAAAEDDHADHDEDHSGGDDEHATQSIDPHAWLNPDVAASWGRLIAESLAASDPANAAAYRANAAEMADEMAVLASEIETMLADVPRDAGYLVSHDAYQYFEHRFAIPAAGAIALSDGIAPGAASLAGLRDRIASDEVVCLLTDPESAPGLADLLTEGTQARVAPVDADGITLAPGPDLYPRLLRAIAKGYVDCLG